MFNACVNKYKESNRSSAGQDATEICPGGKCLGELGGGQGECLGVTCPVGELSRMSSGKNVWRTYGGENIRILMQDYKSLHVSNSYNLLFLNTQKYT